MSTLPASLLMALQGFPFHRRHGPCFSPRPARPSEASPSLSSHCPPLRHWLQPHSPSFSPHNTHQAVHSAQDTSPRSSGVSLSLRPCLSLDFISLRDFPNNPKPHGHLPSPPAIILLLQPIHFLYGSCHSLQLYISPFTHSTKVIKPLLCARYWFRK